MSEPKLGRLKRVDLRTCWESEPRDFTPWLAEEENIALLGETLGIKLEMPGTETSVLTRRRGSLLDDSQARLCRSMICRDQKYEYVNPEEKSSGACLRTASLQSGA